MGMPSSLENILPHLKGVRKSLRGWVACCPSHHDQQPSLSIGLGNEGQILLKCFAGCSLESIVAAMGISVADLFPDTPSKRRTKDTRHNALSLIDLAQDKLLPWQYLCNLGVIEDTAGGIQILYHLPDGTPAPRSRLRTALVAGAGSRWSKGKGAIVAYGLERLKEARKAGYLVIVEGESDCWTLWYHHFPALGLPGADMVNTLEQSYLEGINTLYVIREPDAAGAKFVKAIEQRLAAWRWSGKASVVSLTDAKDPNALHKQNVEGFKAAFQQALDRAEPLFIIAAHSQPAPSPSEYRPSPFTLQELLARELPPVRWAIPDILPEGLTLLAGKPKLGKSWLALSVALAVAAGGFALGKQPVTQGEVLYLALEDNERRLQSRAKQLLASMTCVPSGIEFELSWPRLDQGGLTHLEAYVKAHLNVRLVVVDTWAKVSPQSNGRQRSQYEGDYEALTPLKYLADTYRVSILAVHHLRKMSADDVLDEVSGSIGVTGAVDGALILKRERGQGEATLFVTGRDIEQEQQLALTFDPITAMWTLVGNAEEFRRTRERQGIIDLLTEQLPEGMSPRQVAEALDKNYHTTRSLLRKMEDGGEVRHTNNQYFALSKDISRNQRHQTAPSAVQLPGQIEPVEEHSPTSTDYVDDTDYADYTNDSAPSNMSHTHEPASPLVDAPLQPAFATCTHPQAEEVVQQSNHNQESAVISVINRNQRNQSEVTSPHAMLPNEDTEGGVTLDATDESSEKEQAGTVAISKARCPHHSHAQWVHFDPAGQAWCDKMDCWDCYRLMRIGEALGYQQLPSHSSTTTIIGRGIEAWAAFVISQGSFAVATATRQAIALCKALGVEVPDLSGEVQHLVSAW